MKLAIVFLLVLSAAAETKTVTARVILHDNHQYVRFVEGTSHTAYRYTAVLAVGDTLYGVHCDEVKIWDRCRELLKPSYTVDLERKTIKITDQFQGNMHKAETIKYEIDAIEPAQSVAKN
jgi:hypothetical protein